MPICPAGHHSAATDFCDTCGLPLPVEAATPVPPPAPAPLQPPAALVCPACGTPNVAEALFCEACGHDFIGGHSTPTTIPEAAQSGSHDSDAPELTPEPSTSPEPDEGPPSLTTPEPVAGPPSPETLPDDEVSDPSAAGTAGVLARGATEPAEGSSEPAGTALDPDEASPPPHYAPRVDWIAELWIDPDWYAAQGSTDPLPSPGLPDIVPLVKESNLIGRISTSRNIYPEIDCELDTGCSRRHARLTTDGSRWWIEDLESANGTFLGTAAGPLPAMPIARGKVELAPDQRIYLGAWTRIVVRRATEDEQEAFAGLTS
ncbi:MAG: FHA domain-containing protein [Propionicimonas sp.]